MKSWYEIKAKKDSADLYIYDELGLFGIPASDFVKEVGTLSGKALNVFINSPGGRAYDGIAIYNALNRHDAPVNVMVDGLAASAASVIAQAGTTRTMAPASAMMIHDAWGIVSGDAAYLEKIAGEFDADSQQIAGIYAAKAGGTSDEWRERMKAETWYRGQEAVDVGLADRVAEGSRNAYSGRTFSLARFEKVPDWVPQGDTAATFTTINFDWMKHLTAEPVQTSPHGQEDEMDETAIRQALGLDDTGDILASITALKTAKDVAEATLKADAPDKAEAANLRAQLQERQGEVLSLKTKHAEEILRMRDEMRRKEATSLVESAVQAGFVLPADRGLAYDLAYNNPDAFEQFKSRQRVDLTERGSAAALDGIDVTPEELAVANQFKQSRDDLIKSKAAERGR